ncbi:MAG: DUF3592 domain-containing protein [Actinobacteria bacterium]|nr:DUF3592 domain-containing protein [Actinomycetota bacterium]
MNQEPTTRRLGWVLAGIGIVLTAIAIFLVVTSEGTANWVSTEAVVVDVDKDDGVVVGSTLRFRDPTDNAYDIKSSFGDEDTRRGTKVNLTYNPSNPTQILLEGETAGQSIHFSFIFLFGLIAVWGVVIALYDPQLTPIPTRPDGIAGTAFWIAAFSIIAVLALHSRVDGLSEIGTWLLGAVGLVLAFGIWRVMAWARIAGIAYAGVVLAVVVVHWAQDANRWGAPLFWHLLLAGVWALVLLALTRKETAKAYARLRQRRIAAAAAAGG